MADFIYDEQGVCVARIVNGEVIAELTRKKFATARDGVLYSNEGKTLGHLQNANLIGGTSAKTPACWRHALAEASK